MRKSKRGITFVSIRFLLWARCASMFAIFDKERGKRDGGIGGMEEVRIRFGKFVRFSIISLNFVFISSLSLIVRLPCIPSIFRNCKDGKDTQRQKGNLDAPNLAWARVLYPSLRESAQGGWGGRRQKNDRAFGATFRFAIISPCLSFSLAC